MRSIDVSFWKEAISFWKEAINSELDSIVSDQNWELVKLPKGCKPISSKWIFKKKLKPEGFIDKYKVRLVIRGFNQKKGVDYFDTYSLVTKIATITILVALVIISCLVVRQMYVKTTS